MRRRRGDGRGADGDAEDGRAEAPRCARMRAQGAAILATVAGATGCKSIAAPGAAPRRCGTCSRRRPARSP
eukprot:scaffold2268_cov349-Prasinococcus_capsulatus_cf.AAC.12